jgi:DNA-binding beta-propeller fold protein YncE
VDGKGTVLIFRAFDPAVLVFNRAGEFQKSWGEGVAGAHSIDIDRDGFVWLSDRFNHQVFKYTMDGKLLMTLGKKRVAGDNSSTDLFNGPADVAIGRNGDIFVADGHINSRIVKFTKDGKFIKIIGGTKGSAPGQFNVPHAIAIDSRGRLLVSDQQREERNSRIQIFDRDGNFIEQWKITPGWPTALAIGPDDTVYIGDIDANTISLWKDGKMLDVIGSLQAGPHSIAIDPATGVLYLTDPVWQERLPASFNSPVKRVLHPITQDAGDAIDGGIVKQVVPKRREPK